MCSDNYDNLTDFSVNEQNFLLRQVDPRPTVDTGLVSVVPGPSVRSAGASTRGSALLTSSMWVTGSYSGE